MLLVSGASATYGPRIAADPDLFGVLAVPGAWNTLPESCKWAADNGAFSGFDEGAFLAMLERHRWAKERCLWVAAPDVVGDAEATLSRFEEWAPRIAALGYKPALVAQNGLFVGGVPGCTSCSYVRPVAELDRKNCPTCGRPLIEWKCGAAAAHLISEAQYRCKWVHMGRVNGGDRLRLAHCLGCDSVDGSGWSRWPVSMLQSNERLLQQLRSSRRLFMAEENSQMELAKVSER
jgi:ssDNA-binding Zn-finger/Zn-ribbon topoisomerase 1